MTRIETRGPKVGRCNICGDHGPLTDDHTPPKGAAQATQVEIRTICALLSTGQETGKFRASQNGVKFRTLCARCNSKTLGKKYDPALIEFTMQVSNYLKSILAIPNTMIATGHPHRIARSVVGHLCAIGVNRHFKGPHTEEVTNWFLDESKPFPEFFNIYYWTYPHRAQVLIRGAGYHDMRFKDGAAHIWLMKFFPVAFLVVWDKTDAHEFSHLASLRRWDRVPAASAVEMPVQIKRIPHERWPELPTPTTFLVYDSATALTAKRRKGDPGILV